MNEITQHLGLLVKKHQQGDNQEASRFVGEKKPTKAEKITDGTGANYTGAGFRNLTGSSTAYQYDPNGNLTNDYYKGLQNSYNVLNRTDKIIVTTGTNQYINYIYDAGGSLIRKLEYNGGTLQTQTDYIGGFVYVNSALSYFPIPEGRVINNSGTLTQEFIITDQQGNARISFQDNGSGVAVVKQENSYYGFGLQLLNSPVSLPAVPNKQLYNGGSEWQNDYANGSTNLPDYYQTFYRNYDAAIGRFVGQDPMPESVESMSVYQYAGNMPVMANDPMGNLKNLNAPTSFPTTYNPYTASQWGVFANHFDIDPNLGGNDPAFGGGGSILDTYGPGTAYAMAMAAGTAFYNAGDPNSPLSYGQMIEFLHNSGVDLSLSSSDQGDVLALYRGQEVWFSGDGTLISAHQLHAGYTDAIIAHQLGNGNEQNAVSEADLLVLVANQPVNVPDAGEDGEGLLEALWNSPLARFIVPDDIGLHLSATLVPTVGGRYSINLDLLTRGKDAGFHLSHTLSGRAGEEGGIELSLSKGWYNGNGQDATYNTLTGWGVDADSSIGPLPISAGGWASFDPASGHVNWVGSSVGFNYGVGGSGGVGYTSAW
ncbi:MAG TPA: RHS repeat-associated core domain-containing protein [Mucilaginibacter sp.]|jgi:RHS repeat-associated protein|nr:RHS repeat-associated core domain-containing protein [Mucilaginibacter sp.]